MCSKELNCSPSTALSEWLKLDGNHMPCMVLKKRKLEQQQVLKINV